MGTLSGKIALVTGAGGMRGIGRSIALTLARLGADVAISDVRREHSDLPPDELKSNWKSIESVAREIEQLGRRALPCWCDLRKSEEIEKMVRQVLDQFGRIDILVNNARAIIGRDRVPIVDLPEDIWRDFLTINTTAPFLTIKHVAKAMISNGQGGRIVNIASDAGKRGTPKNTAYTTSKFAVLGLTQCAALDLAPYNITVNAVCPGTIDSGRMNHLEQKIASEKGQALEDYQQQVVAQRVKGIPLGRAGTSQDVANLAAFLASDEASFITGQSYSVNGGATV